MLENIELTAKQVIHQDERGTQKRYRSDYPRCFFFPTKKPIWRRRHAAPVFGFREFDAVLAVTGEYPLPENTVRPMYSLVCESAKEISRKMGFQAENSGGEAGSPDKSTP